MTTRTAVAQRVWWASGLIPQRDPDDRGLLRLRRGDPIPPVLDEEAIARMRLVGEIVIRRGRITYAEIDGQIFPFHKHDPRSYELQERDLFQTIEES